MKTINDKKFLRNSLFNTVYLHKKKILKKNFTQYDIQKKFGNFYSGIYAIIYNKLFEKNINNFYRGPKSQKINKKKKNYLRFIYINKLLLNNLILVLQIIFFSIFVKKRVFPRKMVFQNLFGYSNQMSFTPIAKKMSKKDYYVLTKTFNYKDVKFLRELYGYKNIINIYEFYDFISIFKAFLLIIKNWKKIFFIKKIFLISNFGLLKLFFQIYKNYCSYLVYFKVLKKINPKKSLLMCSIGNEMFIAASKDACNTKLYGYAVQGVSFTGQSLTSQFLFNSLDKLFCYGHSDQIHFNNISKNNIFIFPKKIISCGSVRDYYFSKKKKNKKNSNLKILYLRSNHIWFGDIDSVFLDKLSKILKKKFDKKFDYRIKERNNFYSGSSKGLINRKIINKSNVLIDIKKLTEDLIYESDIIVGTVSTSIIYQSLYFKKLIIQFGYRRMPWLRNINKMGINCVNRDDEILKIFINLKKDKNFYKRLISKQKKLSNYLIERKKNPITIILNELKRIND